MGKSILLSNFRSNMAVAAGLNSPSPAQSRPAPRGLLAVRDAILDKNGTTDRRI